jgi:DNA relaxase NicK
LTVFQSGQKVRALVAREMGVKDWAFERGTRGAQGYRETWLGPLGVRVYTNPVSGPEQCHVSIGGSCLEAMGAQWVQRLTLQCYRAGWEARATRVDLAMDGEGFTPADCRELWERGEVRSYSRRDCWGWQCSQEGNTFSIGSRTSERYGRVYDKRGFTRFEVECKGDRAAAVWADLCVVDPREWGETIRAHVRDFVEFLAPWWDEFMGGVVRALLVVGSAARATADKARQWLRRQVAPWIAALTELDGGELGWLLDLVAEGRTRYGLAQRVALAAVEV